MTEKPLTKRRFSKLTLVLFSLITCSVIIFTFYLQAVPTLIELGHRPTRYELEAMKFASPKTHVRALILIISQHYSLSISQSGLTTESDMITELNPEIVVDALEDLFNDSRVRPQSKKRLCEVGILGAINGPKVNKSYLDEFQRRLSRNYSTELTTRLFNLFVLECCQDEYFNNQWRFPQLTLELLTRRPNHLRDRLKLLQCRYIGVDNLCVVAALSIPVNSTISIDDRLVLYELNASETYSNQCIYTMLEQKVSRREWTYYLTKLLEKNASISNACQSDLLQFAKLPENEQLAPLINKYLAWCKLNPHIMDRMLKAAQSKREDKED